MDPRKSLYFKFCYALNTFINFHYALNKFIVFIYIYYVFVIIPFPLVIWVWKSLVVLADYVRLSWGINNHVNPQGIGPIEHPPWLNSVIYIIYYVVNIVYFSPFSLVIWVWKSRLVVVDYVRPQWGINNHIILWGIGPTKILCLKLRYFHYLLRYCKYCPFFHFDLGMKIPNGIGGLDKSFNSTKPM